MIKLRLKINEIASMMSGTLQSEEKYTSLVQSLFNGAWEAILKNEMTYKIPTLIKSELNNNGLLLSNDILERIKNDFNESCNIKIRKDGKQTRSVIKAIDGTLYALYTGKNDKSEPLFVVRKENVYIKYAQNLSTGEICLVKIQKFNGTECDFLARQELLIGTATKDKSSDYRKQYIFMKLIPGVTQKRLKEILKENKMKLSKSQEIDILLSAFSEIRKLMANEIWHQDLHDGNIMIDPVSWRTTVIDFGIAKDSGKYQLLEDKLCDQYSVAQNIIRTMDELITDSHLCAFLKRTRISLERDWICFKTIYDLKISITELEALKNSLQNENFTDNFEKQSTLLFNEKKASFIGTIKQTQESMKPRHSTNEEPIVERTCNTKVNCQPL